MRVALYARNSKPPRGWKPSFPGEEPPSSYRSQLARLRAWAAREGHEIILEEYDIASGGNPNRPGWKRVLASARGHHVHVVAAVKLDRVSRSVRHFCEIADEFLALKVDLFLLDQPEASVRAAGAFATFMRNQFAAWAQLERDLAMERSAEVLEVRQDGRLYGPRSDLPAGRPREFDASHKLRKRKDGSLEHDRARCRACRVGKMGVAVRAGTATRNEGVGEPDGSPAPSTLAARVRAGFEAARASGRKEAK